MAVEIASAYVSLSVSTANIPRQMRAAFANAGAEGERAGQQAGDRMGSSFGASLKKGAGAAIGALGVGTGVAALVGGFQQVIKVGNDFTTELNTMSAVSGATAEQLEAVSQRSRELGNDISLPGTSAGDAAAAMTELAKGGFTVEQSMAAAKGTLQLAAAAQIDAASAATIQSQALQAFGLNADYAAKTSDVLANAANASSAEITDIANGLQQSGAVANQFGLTIEDTATALGLFANSGIQGSDAGTLLKSALLALTDTSNPAQGAIEELGLTVYDAQGQFVGLSSLFGQLDEAAASMTDEQYQAATATLFGSDAMRLAGVAAQVGSAGFDQMQTAINRQGAAAEVAAAKTQGLPGAMAAVGNAAESVALQVYDLVKGPLTSFATSAADGIDAAAPKIIGGLEGIGSVAAPAGSAIGSLISTIAGLPTPLLAGAAAFGALRLASARFGTQVGSTATSAVTGLRNIATANNAIASAGASGSVAMGRFGSSIAQIGQNVPAVARMQTAFLQGATQADRFARSAGAARAATAGIGSAVGAASSALGGPWMLAFAGATVAITGIVDASKRADEQQRILTKSSAEAAIAQRDVAKAFQDSKGAVTDTTIAAVAVQFDQLRTAQEGIAKSGPTAFSVFEAGAKDITGWFSGVAQAGTDAYNKSQDQAEAAGALSAALNELGFSNEELAAKTSGSNVAFATFKANLANTASGGQDAAAAVQKIRDGIVEAQRSATTLEPGFLDLAAAIDVLADSSATADEKSSALKRTLDVLAGRPVALSEAVSAYEETIAKVADTTSDAIDQTKGFGDALVANGGLNLATENGRTLQDTLLGIRDATAEVISQGGDADATFAKNDQAFLNLANQYGVGVTQIEQFAAALGYLPDAIVSNVAVDGADEATQQMQLVANAFAQLPQGDLDVEVQVDDAGARQNLEQLGFTIEQVPGTKNVKVTAPNEIALTALQAVIDKTNEAGRNSATPKIDADTTSFFLQEGAARTALAQVDASSASPEIRAIIDNLLQGKQVSLAALSEIDATNANPEVILAIQQALQNAQTVNDAIDRASRNRTVQIQLNEVYGAGSRRANDGAARFEADGGVLKPGAAENHVAQIARPGEWRVWAEDETGGEAYIPLAQSKRGRSTDILADVAGRFGYRLETFADGGVVSAMQSIVQKRWPMMQLTSGYRNEPGSYHNTGQAADFSNGGDAGTPEMRDLAGFIADNYMSATAELIHSPFGSNIKDGADVGDGMSVYGAGTMAQHRNHVHWAMTSPPSEPVEQAPAEEPAPALSAKESYVDAIVAEGRRRNITDKGITIALATMLAESDGIMYANNSVPGSLDLPHEAVGSDTDSVGLFQQRDNGAWGSLEDRMDPARSAGMFYEELAKLDYENMDPAAAAQAVQRSAFADGSNYAARVGEAEGLLAAANARSLNPVKTVTVDPVEVAEVAQAEAEKPKDPNAAPAPSAQQPSAPSTFNLQERGRKYVTDVAGILYDAALEQLPFGLGQSRLLSLPIPDLTPQPVTVPAGTQPQEPKQWVPEMLETGNFPGVATAGVQEDSPVVDFILKLREAIPQIPVFDSGGWVRPGLNLINNKTGGPELLRNATGDKPVPQPGLTEESMGRMLSERPNVQFNVTDIDEALRKYTNHQKREALTFARR